MIKFTTKRIVKSIISITSAAIIAAAACITAEAKKSESLSVPKLSAAAVCADKIVISVDNASDFPSGTSFEIYCGESLLKTVSAENGDRITLTNDGEKYLKADTTYKIKIKAIAESKTAAAIKVTTESDSYYKISKGTKLYKYTNEKMKAQKKASVSEYSTGILTTNIGAKIAGRSVKKYSGEYVKLTSGSYKGYLVKVSDTVRASRVTAQRAIVSEYGRSMDGGTYVYGAAMFKRTDCSGLTMQCYNQIGINITHSVYYQSKFGKSVNVKNMKAGDLIILNNKSHVALYIGDGMMVHAMNPTKGIRVEPITKLQYYHIDDIKRIIE